MHSDVTQKVKTFEAKEISVHAVFLTFASGELLFLGPTWRMSDLLPTCSVIAASSATREMPGQPLPVSDLVLKSNSLSAQHRQ